MSRRAILIAGTHSGSGKTTITLGMMAALKKLGLSLMPFKCGPDFIDPSLHRLVTGSISRNLDLWMMGESFTKECFLRHADDCDIAVVEGVMGMFDGGPASSAALAKALGIPLILVLDVRSAAESGAAVLKGFETLDPDIRPQGVILNMVGSSRHYDLVRTAIEKHCQAEVLGYLPRTLDFSIPSRHLGLHMGEESPITADKIDALAQSIIKHIDMNRLLAIADISDSSGQPFEHRSLAIAPKVRLGVARDKAFCFYYEDNFDLLRQAGAEICWKMLICQTESMLSIWAAVIPNSMERCSAATTHCSMKFVPGPKMANPSMPNVADSCILPEALPISTPIFMSWPESFQPRPPCRPNGLALATGKSPPVRPAFSVLPEPCCAAMNFITPT